MLKRCIQLLGLARNTDSGRNTQVRGSTIAEGSASKEVGAPISLDFSLKSNNFVRIVHSGGREELYQNVVPASLLMEKYPGTCVACPEVFKNPQESLLRPEESLLPGQKYYIILTTTAQKIKHKHRKKARAKETAEGKESPDGIIVNARGWDTDESVCSAKDYYASKERWSKHLRRKGIRGKKPFVPPLPKTKSCRGLGWEPSLTSVQELSP